MDGDNELQQTRAIQNVFLSNNDFHHIAVAVHDVQLTVVVDGVFRLQQVLIFPVVIRIENIFIGVLNDGETPTLQGTVYTYTLSIYVCVYVL